MLHRKVFALVIATSISAIAYPAILRMSDNLLENLEDAVVEMRTTAEIYDEFFGSEKSADIPAISDELASKLQFGAWYKTPETDQGNSRQEILDRARKINQRKTVKPTSKSATSVQSNQSSTQITRYRKQTKQERTRSKLISTASSRIKQSIRNRKLSTAQNKRQRERSRGVVASTRRPRTIKSTRRFRHTRSGTTPGY